MNRIDEIATGLAQDWWVRTAYRTLTGDEAPADMAEAYAIQAALQPMLAERRGPIAGRKIALSSKAMQQMVGIDQPVAGAFFRNDILNSPAEVDLATFRHMGLECELAFVLGRDLPPGADLDKEKVLDAVAEVRPAFELIEDKDADYSAIDALTLVADNAWCGAVVLGGPLAGWRNLDLANLPAELHQDGEPPEPTNTGAADPISSLLWVLRHFHGLGQTVQAGETIITGSVVRTRFPALGDRFVYRISDLAEVELSIS